jgi:hypothetical protein
MTDYPGVEPMDSTLPFNAYPARPRRPWLGGLLIAGGYFIPISLVMADIYYSLSGFLGTTTWRAPLTILLASGSLAGIFLARRMFKVGAGLRQPNALELLKIDRRAPILYLRSFDDDSVTDLTESVIPFGPQQTIEMRLSQVFEELGPFVSIGRPGERLPEIGANRFYVSDDDWQKAVLYFLQSSAAVVILVGRSTGVTWEIQTALNRVPRRKILFVFPYLLPKAERTRRRTIRESIRLRGRGDDSVSKSMLADLREEHETRYQAFRSKFGAALATDLPPRIDRDVFLDFVDGGKPRLIPTRRPLFIRRRRDKQGLTLDYRRTLRPFLGKLQGHIAGPDRIEWFFTNKFTLGAFTLVCGILGIIGFFSPFFLGFSALGLLTFFLTLVPLNLAYWGAWNLFQVIRWEEVLYRLVAAVVGYAVGSVLGGIVIWAAVLLGNAELSVGLLIEAFIYGMGGGIAGFIAGLRLRVLGWVFAVTMAGILIALTGHWLAAILLTNGAPWNIDAVLAMAFPFIAVGGAIWGVRREAAKGG